MQKDYHAALLYPPLRVNHVSFNQDQTCFACATNYGFHIYNSCPYGSTFCRDLGGSVRIVEMLFKTNILAFVGSGSNPLYPPNKVIIWDDHEQKCVGELCFKHPVRGIRLRKDVVVTILDSKVYVYQLADFKLVSTVNTWTNPKGLCAITYEEDSSFLVVPSKEGPGNIQIINAAGNTSLERKAHVSELAAIALSKNSKYCATASAKGTLIRIFSTDEGRLLRELRRGVGSARIESLVFNSTSQWIGCSSNKNTVHVFSLSREEESKNTKSVLKFMQGLASYFKSEWSMAQLKLNEGGSIISFGPEGTNTIIGKNLSNGVLIKSSRDEDGKILSRNI